MAGQSHLLPSTVRPGKQQFVKLEVVTQNTGSEASGPPKSGGQSQICCHVIQTILLHSYGIRKIGITRQTKASISHQTFQRRKKFPLKIKQIKKNVNFDGSHGDVIWKAELGLCWEVQLSWLEICMGAGVMEAQWAHPTRLWHPTSPCLVGRGYRLSENWREKTWTICVLFNNVTISLFQFHKEKQTCRKGNGPVWCWGATQHERRGSRALGGSQAAPARPDHEAAAPPAHISTNMAGSPGSASTNIATTAGSPGLGETKEAFKTHPSTSKHSKKEDQMWASPMEVLAAIL